jgi:pSer/pThr/pTyr-binding forkhead associated (FHA) protein
MKIITIGRHESNEVVINDSNVSRNHLQIIQDDNNNFTAVDLNSTNGTFVNGQRIYGEVHLLSNSSVRIGNTTLAWQQYFTQQSAPVATSAPAQQVPAKKSPLKSLSKIKMWHIAAAVAAVLLIGGGTTIFFVQKAKQEKIELAKAQQAAEEKAKQEVEQKEQQLQTAREKEDRLREEAATLARKALISKSKDDEEALKQLNANLALAAQDTKKKENALTDANNRLNALQQENDKLKKDLADLTAEKKNLKADADKTVEELKKEMKVKEDAISAVKEKDEELKKYEKQRLEKLYDGFDDLIKSYAFKNIDPKKKASEKDESQWIDAFGRRESQKDVLANKAGVKTFEQKQAVYDLLKAALDKKQVDFDNAEAAKKKATAPADTISKK